MKVRSRLVYEATQVMKEGDHPRVKSSPTYLPTDKQPIGFMKTEISSHQPVFKTDWIVEASDGKFGAQVYSDQQFQQEYEPVETREEIKD